MTRRSDELDFLEAFGIEETPSCKKCEYKGIECWECHPPAVEISDSCLLELLCYYEKSLYTTGCLSFLSPESIRRTVLGGLIEIMSMPIHADRKERTKKEVQEIVRRHCPVAAEALLMEEIKR